MTSRFNQKLQHLSVSQVRPSSLNPRADVGDVSELADSIRAKGIVQPLTVREHPSIDGDFEVIAGHRRLAAAKKAGLLSIPCIVDASIKDDKTVLQTMLIENVQRANITKSEEASAIQGMLDLGMNINQVAKSIGRKHETVESRVKLAGMSERTQKLVDSGNATLERVMKIDEFKDSPEIKADLEQHIDSFNFEWEYNRAKEIKRWHDNTANAYDALVEIGFAVKTVEEVCSEGKWELLRSFDGTFPLDVEKVANLEASSFESDVLEGIDEYCVVLNHSTRTVQWYKLSAENVSELSDEPTAEELAERKLRESAETALRTSRVTFVEHMKAVIAKPKKIKHAHLLLTQYIVGVGYKRKDIADLLGIEIPEGVSTYEQVSSFLVEELQKFTAEQLALSLMLVELGASTSTPYYFLFDLDRFDPRRADASVTRFSREVLREAVDWQESPGEKLAREYWQPNIDIEGDSDVVKDEVNF
ncbi:ParB/RepB/Spo0J family partition protein [Rothia terrae]|uniref:ParB/RepB/Spo0J family partition protein n=1 Tax=Rothia terrae TaxID=396015 RepID=UPI003809E59A